jgi:DNA repair protein RadA/Sms
MRISPLLASHRQLSLILYSMADKTLFYCTNCGNDFPKWVGQCPACQSWNTLTEYKAPKATKNASHKDLVQAVRPQDLRATANEIISTHISEFDRVLGGGLTPGGVYLISGQPGIGKSTLLSLLSLTHSTNYPVYYVCAEENPSQVTSRLYRLDPENKTIDQISLLGTNALSDILHHLSKAEPKSLLIVDSIQTIETDSAPGQAGTPSQIRACASEIIKLTKHQKIITLIVGHVTKAGVLAGPKLLEHMVDVVLELEGDRHYDLRLLRGIKNPFWCHRRDRIIPDERRWTQKRR